MLSRTELLALIPILQGQNAQLTALILEQQERIEQFAAMVAALQAENESLRRGGHRQAAPFSKGTHKSEPKKPGRKPGSGNFTRRLAPPPESITEMLDAPVQEVACPQCGGALEEQTVELATTTELPEVVRPIVTGFRVQVCRCTKCGQRVRGQHARLPADQQGATAHRVGARAMATAHWLHYGMGVPLRKAPQVLRQMTGVQITQSALTQDAMRQAAGRVGKVYQQLREGVRDTAYVHTDDTGWRVGGFNAQLMAFETLKATVYQIRSQHRNEEVREIIPADYAGVMITDRGRSYDAREFEQVKQHKCLSHIHRSIDAVIEKKKQAGGENGGKSGGKSGGENGAEALEFCLTLKLLLKKANQLWRHYHDSQSKWFRHITFPRARARLLRKITAHLRYRDLADPDCQRLLRELGRHHSRGNLVRFLVDPQIPPTNNAAERALRPAVIARKVSQCSKNTQGAEAFCAFTSVLRTATKRGLDPIQTLHWICSESGLAKIPP